MLIREIIIKGCMLTLDSAIRNLFERRIFVGVDAAF